MKKTVALCILLCGKLAPAHRIDEYLQATLFSLETDRVQASMRLIPGVLVAPSVIAGIDTDGDGIFSQSEERAYAQRVLGDLSITVDGTNVRPVLASWRFPELSQMRDGMGEVHIEYTIEYAVGKSAGVQDHGPNRSLIVANHHLSRTSVYLMNALVPQDGGIQIVVQKRNEQQSLYELDFRQLDATDTAWSNIRPWLSGIHAPACFALACVT